MIKVQEFNAIPKIAKAVKFPSVTIVIQERDTPLLSGLSKIS